MLTLDRETYKQIKKMDRIDMQTYLDSLHEQWFNEGVSAFGKQLADRVDAGIRKTNGIGEKRYTELIANINEELNKPITDEETKQD